MGRDPFSREGRGEGCADAKCNYQRRDLGGGGLPWGNFHTKGTVALKIAGESAGNLGESHE